MSCGNKNPFYVTLSNSCFCGEYKEGHTTYFLSNEPSVKKELKDKPWSEETHLRYIRPTEAFGQIEYLTETTTSQRPAEVSPQGFLFNLLVCIHTCTYILQAGKCFHSSSGLR